MGILAACHLHSTWSYDGSWALEDLRTKFGRHGCRVLMMTEHDRGFSAARLEEYRNACAKASTDRVLVVPGIEYSDPTNRIHVLVWGNVPFLGEGLPTTRMLEAVKANNGVAVLAHPGRGTAWKLWEPSWAELLLGVEAWNRKYDGWAPSKTAPSLLELGGAVPFVGLDFHTARQSFPVRMVLEMGPEVTEESVVGCLRSRRCHGQAFGMPLTSDVLRGSFSALRMAERARRTAARFVRSTRSRLSK